MENLMRMGTTGRHNRLTMTISGRIIDLLSRKEVYALSEEGALVHWGFINKPDEKRLINLNDIENLEYFSNYTINELDWVQPDFMLFKNNKYICNDRETKIAGLPDLIIEVWSDGNSKFDREFKFNLYSSSDITEHWYIEQDSNEVICYLGKNRLENQYLTNVLETRGGLEFDLRYLAI